MNTHGGVGLIDIEEDVPVQVKVTHTEVGALTEAGGITHGEFREKLHGNVTIEAVTLITIGITLQDRVIVCVATAEVVTDSLGTAGDGQIELLVQSELAINLVVPVGVNGLVGLALGVNPSGISVFVSSDLRIGPAVTHLTYVGHSVFPLHEGRPAFYLTGNHGNGKANIG